MSNIMSLESAATSLPISDSLLPRYATISPPISINFWGKSPTISNYRLFDKRVASRFLPNEAFQIRNLLFIPSDILAIGTEIFCQPFRPLQKYPLQSHFLKDTQQVEYRGSKLLPSLEMSSLGHALEITESGKV
jgi:hypothetical protein